MARMGSSNASLSGTRQMTQAAKAQEPSMEEILASIRRIIADDDAAKSPASPASPPPVATAPPPAPTYAPAPAAPSSNETVLDEMLAELNAAPAPASDAADDPASDVLDLTEAMAGGPAAGFRTIDGQSDIVFEDSPPERLAEPAPAFDGPRFPERGQRSLLSSAP